LLPLFLVSLPDLGCEIAKAVTAGGMTAKAVTAAVVMAAA